MTCSRCSQPPRPGQRWCRSCHAANMREWRKTHRLTGVARRKMNARSYANTYQKRGKLMPKPCEKCGNPKAEKHHSDYLNPLKVHWLCRTHHLALHRSTLSATEVVP